MDSYYIDTTFIYGDFLQINIEYAGGCEDHIFNLVHEFIFCGTPPVYISIKLRHNANEDLCEALITEDLCFDISSIYAGYEHMI